VENPVDVLMKSAFDCETISHILIFSSSLIDGIKYGWASVCIPPSFVKAAKAYTGDKIKICTVIGFPNGYSTTEVKCANKVWSTYDNISFLFIGITPFFKFYVKFP